MKNPLRTRFMKHFPVWLVIQAKAQLREQGFEVDETSQNPLHWVRVADYCQYLLDELHESPYAQPALNRPVVQPPSLVPAHKPAPNESIFSALEVVGAIRGVHLVADRRGGYALTVKLDIPGTGKVYRYGRLLDASGVEALIYRWLAKGYWTPDKQ